jgi:hypothetical protein
MKLQAVSGQAIGLKGLAPNASYINALGLNFRP